MELNKQETKLSYAFLVRKFGLLLNPDIHYLHLKHQHKHWRYIFMSQQTSQGPTVPYDGWDHT